MRSLIRTIVFACLFFGILSCADYIKTLDANLLKAYWSVVVAFILAIIMRWYEVEFKQQPRN